MNLKWWFSSSAPKLSPFFRY